MVAEGGVAVKIRNKKNMETRFQYHLHFTPKIDTSPAQPRAGRKRGYSANCDADEPKEVERNRRRNG